MVPTVVFIVNNMVSEVLGVTLFELLHGFKALLLEELLKSRLALARSFGIQATDRGPCPVSLMEAGFRRKKLSCAERSGLVSPSSYASHAALHVPEAAVHVQA